MDQSLAGSTDGVVILFLLWPDEESKEHEELEIILELQTSSKVGASGNTRSAEVPN